MRRILIPTDFSENAKIAITYASSLFAGEDMLFILLHIDKTTKQEHCEPSDIDSFKSINQELKETEALFTDPKHKLQSISCTGSFITNIRKIIAEKQIDMIVMGTKGTNSKKRMPIGTNTQSVITKIKCPVLVIPGETTYMPIKDVVFPTDFYVNFSNEALAPLTHILLQYKSVLHVVYRATNPSLISRTQLINREFLENIHSEIDIQLHKIVSTNLRDELEKYITAQNTQLVAMPAKNLNFIQQLLSRPSAQTDSIIRKTPFLFLHDIL